MKILLFHMRFHPDPTGTAPLVSQLAEDLAAAAVFLMADGAGFISGVTLPVDGAYLCQNI